MPDSDGLLTCRQCTVRYAWASDWLDLKAENERLREALPHLVTDEMVGEICAIIENRCGTVRGIGPAVREALARVLGEENSPA